MRLMDKVTVAHVPCLVTLTNL